MHTYSDDEIIAFMTRYGWGFGERSVFNEVVVSFSRRDWHGRAVDRPVTVTRFGEPELRGELIRGAGREAWQIWKQFPDVPPAQYFDLQSMSVVWNVHPLQRERRTAVENRGAWQFS